MVSQGVLETLLSSHPALQGTHEDTITCCSHSVVEKPRLTQFCPSPLKTSKLDNEFYRLQRKASAIS